MYIKQDKKLKSKHTIKCIKRKKLISIFVLSDTQYQYTKYENICLLELFENQT